MELHKSYDMVVMPRVERITFEDLDLLCNRLMVVQDLIASDLQSVWSQAHWRLVEQQLQRKLAQMRSMFDLQGK